MINATEETVGSIRALAKRLGRSHVAVTNWRKRDDWPFGQSGPWPVDEIRAWMERQIGRDNAAEWRESQANTALAPAPDNPPPEAVADATPGAQDADPVAGDMNAVVAQLGPERAAKLRLILERIATEKIKREIISGKYVELAEVEAGRVARVHAARTVLMQFIQRSKGEFAAELAGELPALAEAECARAAELHAQKCEHAVRAALQELAGDA